MLAPDLTGRVVVVTGAAGRLGTRLAEAFVRQGATVAAVVRRDGEAEQLAARLPAGGVRAFVADVADEAAVEALFSDVRAAFGPPDVLVHAAGGWAGGAFVETSLADWQGLVEANLTSTFLCFREAARHLMGRSPGGRCGRLIAFTAAQGADRGRAQQAPYAAAKAGVVRLVEAVAAEYDGRGLTAHAIAPSLILYDGAEGAGVSAEHLIDLCLYLCTPAADGLNGAVLRAYGRAR